MSAPVVDRPQRSLGAELRTPRSLGLLLVALLVAATFAALAQWQLGRAVQNGDVVARATEKSLPLTSVATPQRGQTDESVGQLVTTSGHYAAGDALVVADRLNDGRSGWWVVGHFITDDPSGAQLAVGMGWTADEATAKRAATELNAEPGDVTVALRGRYIDSDAAAPSVSGPANSLTSVSVPQLVNVWRTDTAGPVYAGVVTTAVAPDGLSVIYSPRPVEQVELNFLNVFYAVEWIVFAGFAFFVWYRVVRDRWLLSNRPADAQDEPGDQLDDRLP